MDVELREQRTDDVLLKDKLGDRFRDHGDWLGALHAIAHEPFADPSFVPMLVEDVAPARTARTVEHASFGRGRVIESLADGKLVIEFDAAGRKTLLSRFVRDV